MNLGRSTPNALRSRDTIYIKSNADFNEQLATFLGNKGTHFFYLKKEGADSPTLKKIEDENHDSRIFSAFISKQLDLLSEWYKSHPTKDNFKQAKDQRLKQIQEAFEADVRNQLKTNNYAHFPKAKLNNAYLLSLKTYLNDLSLFEKLFKKLGSDYNKLITYCKSLEKQKDPKVHLEKFLALKSGKEEVASLHPLNSRSLHRSKQRLSAYTNSIK